MMPCDFFPWGGVEWQLRTPLPAPLGPRGEPLRDARRADGAVRGGLHPGSYPDLHRPAPRSPHGPPARQEV